MTGLADFEQWTVRRDLGARRLLVTLSGLYLRSRLAAYAAGCILGVALCAWGLGSWVLSIPGVGVKGMPFAYIQVFAPALAASVVGSGAYSPFGETERTAARPLPPLRFGHLFGLISCAVLAFTFAALAWKLDGDDQSRMVLTFIRNLGGFSGLALLAAWLVGGRLSWVPPLIFSAYVLMRGMKPDGMEWARWAWPARPATDELSWAISLALLFAGLIFVCVFGPRESEHDSELGDG